MSSYVSYVIRIYRKGSGRTLVGQILEVATDRTRSFATLDELQAAVAGMLGSGKTRAGASPPGARRRAGHSKPKKAG